MGLLAPVRNFHFLYINSTEVTVMASSERNIDPCEQCYTSKSKDLCIDDNELAHSYEAIIRTR
jgi:hypothetical protein